MEHPGRILQHQFLDALGITASELARGLAVDRSTVSRLITGKQSLTPEMAARLGAYFQVPARWWLHMQANHDAVQAAANPHWVADVTPWTPDPDVLLTPKGVRRLDAAVAPRVGGDDGVYELRYDNGAVALVADGP